MYHLNILRTPLTEIRIGPMERTFLVIALAAMVDQTLADTWAGPYMGVFAAETRLTVQSKATAQRGALGIGFGVAEISDAMVGSMTYTDTERKQSVQPGVYAGYLWSQGRLVYGIEADLQDGQKSRASGYHSTQLERFPANTQEYEYQQEFNVHYLASLRGRFGYAQDNWLMYLTAGVAHAKVSTKLNSYAPLTGPTAPPPLFLSSSTSDSASQTGWVAGFGGELSVAPRLRIRAEYLYFDLGDTTVDSHSTVLYNTGALFSSANGRVKSEWRSSSARIGLAYEF
jgi:outer membrane immunogenic protein